MNESFQFTINVTFTNLSSGSFVFDLKVQQDFDGLVDLGLLGLGGLQRADKVTLLDDLVV